MVSILLGVLAGIGLPIQTSVNTRLRKTVGSPYNASLVSFAVAFVFLILLLIITGQGIVIPFGTLIKEPAWIWLGGICGLVFLTGNILLFSKLGGVQTVVLPVMGQILMGLLIDNFGLFYSEKSSLSILRIFGAILVIAGVIIVSLAKEIKRGSIVEEMEEEVEEVKEDVEEEILQKKSSILWLWRLFGIAAGMLSATQIAVNGYLGKVVESPIKASAISFAIGIICLVVLCVILYMKKNPATTTVSAEEQKNPWWMWMGGILGGLYILANIYLSRIIGTGMTVIVLLIGATAGGILVDHFGMFEAPKKPANMMKILGVVIMVAGASVIKLF